jgi:hypothetical protein
MRRRTRPNVALDGRIDPVEHHGVAVLTGSTHLLCGLETSDPLVTTILGPARPNAMASDRRLTLTCENQTSYDCLRRNRRAWHAEGGGVDCLPRSPGLHRGSGITEHYMVISHRVIAFREGTRVGS